MMKWIFRIAIVFVLVLGVALVAGLIMIDNIATAAVSKGAAFATETEADCEKVDIKLFGSSADISNLDIKNPDGFRDKHDSFLKLGSGSAGVSIGSVLSDEIVIPEVTLSDIEISLVSIGEKKNYEVILESLKRFTKDGGAKDGEDGGEGEGKEPPTETKDPKKITIKKVTIERITVKYDFDKDPVLGVLDSIDGEIKMAFDEPIIMTNVGSGGVPMSQISADIITDILVQVASNLTNNLGENLTKHLQGLTGSLAENLGKINLEKRLSDLGSDLNVDKQLDDLTKTINENIGKTTESLEKGLDKTKDSIDKGLNKTKDSIDKGIDKFKDLGGGLLGGSKDKKKESEDDPEE